jgi:serine/threonine protein kinase
MSAPELVAGSVVGGQYTIRSLLHHGGAMATYRAVAAKNREVVLRVYDPAITALPDVVKVLAQHQSISAKLPPQQVVRMIDSGTDTSSGAPFTVTDFETAPSLAQLIERGPLASSDLTALVRNLARAVDKLHASGIEGLTLQPANVFVNPSAQYETHIADFAASLVRRALPASEKAVRWMPWLAPEQIKAQVPPTRAADIFALGLLAFFAATGKIYWRSSQLKTPDVGAIRREILAERMPASVRADELGMRLNPAIDAVFSRVLGFRPTDRYATAREFAVALEAALTGRSIAEVDAAQPPSANVPSATVKSSAVKSSAGGPAAAPASSSGKAAQTAPRNAPPPPRSMAQRATMVGMGSPGAGNPSGPSVPGARPPLSTMLGIGDSEIDARLDALEVDSPFDALETEVTKVMPGKAAGAAIAAAMAPAKAPAPAVTTAKIAAPEVKNAPAKASAPTMTAAPEVKNAPAKASAPTMTAAPAKAEPPAMARTAVLASPATPATAAKPQPPPMPVVPAMPVVQAGTVVPAMPIVQAGAVVPAMPVVQAAAPATPKVHAGVAKLPAGVATAVMPAMPPPMPASKVAELPSVVISDPSPQRRMPPSLPMTPPPAQMADVLAKFEAGPSNPLQGAASSASQRTDVVQASPEWPAATHGDFGAERVETGVAVIGADFVAETPPKSSRRRWIAGVCGLLVLTGGVALALSGGKGPSSRERTASSANDTAPAHAAAKLGAPHPDEPAGAMLPSPAANPVPEGPQEPQPAASTEPVAAAPPAPEVQEPEPAAPAARPPAEAPEPAMPAGDVNSAREPTMPIRHTAGTTATPAAAPASHPAPPKKNCGKFLKRCK